MTMKRSEQVCRDLVDSAGIPEVEINLPAADYIRRDRFDGYHCTFDLYPGENYPLKLISVTPKANANQLYTMRLQMGSRQVAAPFAGNEYDGHDLLQ